MVYILTTTASLGFSREFAMFKRIFNVFFRNTRAFDYSFNLVTLCNILIRKNILLFVTQFQKEKDLRKAEKNRSNLYVATHENYLSTG